MGRFGTYVGYRGLGGVGFWAVFGRLVGLYYFGLGRLLGMGFGGERGVHVFYRFYCFYLFHNGLEMLRYVLDVEYSFH